MPQRNVVAALAILCVTAQAVTSFGQTPATFSLTNTPINLAGGTVLYAVDVNNDGIPDLVTNGTGSGAASFTVSIAKGDGTFNTPVTTTLSTIPLPTWLSETSIVTAFLT